MSDKSKTLLTKHGIKGKSISFDIEGRNEFINGFRTRKKERNAKNSAKKKLKEKKFIEDVKKDAKEAVRSHVKTINRFCRQKESYPELDDVKKKEVRTHNSKTIKYNGRNAKEYEKNGTGDGCNARENVECQPWNMPCSVRITEFV